LHPITALSEGDGDGETSVSAVVFTFAYSAARILQLFSGSVPSLVIVSLHVIPAALFAIIHGSLVYGRRGILIFATLCLSVGTIAESLSLRTGFPFGHYEFTELMAPKLFDLPILLALAYLGMGYVLWVLSLKPSGGRFHMAGIRIPLSTDPVASCRR
jgi:uncharacterized membrane protein